MEPPTPSRPSLATRRRRLLELARQWTKVMWNASLWKQVRWLGVPVCNGPPT